VTASPVIDTSENLMWALKQAFHHGRRTLNDAIRGHGITTAQLGLLNRLAANPGLSGAELARHAMITPQAAQLALAALERQRLVERKQDPNHGRIIRAYLTDEGRRVTTACLADAIAAEERWVSVLDSDEKQALIGLLHRLVDHVENSEQ
jgi:DNA-binding MarR family transcriptional regulator